MRRYALRGLGPHFGLLLIAGVAAAFLLVPIQIYGYLLGGPYGAPIPWGWSPILPEDCPDVFLPLPQGRPTATFSSIVPAADYAVMGAILYALGRWTGLGCATLAAALAVPVAYLNLFLPRTDVVRENPWASLYLWLIPLLCATLVSVAWRVIDAHPIRGHDAP